MNKFESSEWSAPSSDLNELMRTSQNLILHVSCMALSVTLTVEPEVEG
jgi:hypothetical protein